MDIRTKKTKRAIRNAFAQLLTEKELDEITIQDVARTAQINRKTFYNHYDGVYQVADEIANEIVLQFESLLNETDFLLDMPIPYTVFLKLSAILDENWEFYSHLLGTDKNLQFRSKIVSVLEEITKQKLLKQTDLEEWIIDVLLSYTFTGMLTVYQKWVVSDRRQTLEEISETVNVLCTACFNGIKRMHDATA